MREIKFRAWDKGIISEGNEPYGMLYDVQNGHDFGQWYDFQYFINNEDWELMEFTGLQDKNGKDIYEGDIVKYKRACYDWNKPHGKEKYFKDIINDVIFIWGEFKHKDSSFGYEGEDLIPLNECEIIGNIYENPKLERRADANTVRAN